MENFRDIWTDFFEVPAHIIQARLANTIRAFATPFTLSLNCVETKTLSMTPFAPNN